VPVRSGTNLARRQSTRGYRWQYQESVTQTKPAPPLTLDCLLDVAEVEAPELPASWNVAPTQQVYVMGAGADYVRKH
jgi:hypothetical protein